MFQIDLKSRRSIYEQVVDNCKALIISGVLPPDEKMPSVRELSKLLTVNPNTVQKAYRELEYQGFIYTTAGLGSFVAQIGERPMDYKKLSELRLQLKALFDELLYIGVSKEELKRMTDELLDGAAISRVPSDTGLQEERRYLTHDQSNKLI